MKNACFSVRLLLCGISAWTLTARLAWASPCSRASLDQFVTKAQMLEVSAIPEGQALRMCRGLSAEAVQWLAFLYARSGQLEASRKLDEPPTVLPPLQGGAMSAVIARARAGDYRELSSKIEKRDASYVRNTEALLVLARALTRKGLFIRARDLYLAYLQLKPTDAAVESEYLYTYLWERDDAGAVRRFEAVKRRSLVAPLADAVERGLVLARTSMPGSPQKPLQVATPNASAMPATTKAKEANPASPPRATVPVAAVPEATSTLAPRAGHLTAMASLQAMREVYRRETLSATYQGLADARVSGHKLRLRGLEVDDPRAGEVELGFTTEVAGFKFGAHGGYLSLGENAFFGDVFAAIPVVQGLTVESALRRRSLLLERPLPEDAYGLMQDQAILGLRYDLYVEARATLVKEGDYATYERHEMLLRWPVIDLRFPGNPDPKDGRLDDRLRSRHLKLSNRREWLAVRIPLALEVRPHANPNYHAPARLQVFGAGFEWDRRFTHRWRLSVEADHLSMVLKERGAGTRFETEVLTHAGFSVGVDLDQRVSVRAAAQGVWTNREELRRALALRDSIELSVTRVVP